MRDNAVLRRALPLGRGLGRITKTLRGLHTHTSSILRRHSHWNTRSQTHLMPEFNLQ